MKRSKRRTGFLLACVAPATILFFIFMVVPTLNVFRMSLYERGAYSPTETFVGFQNFNTLFKDARFIQAMQNTILLIVVVTIITFALALIFAGILTREKIRGQNFSAWCSISPTFCLWWLSPAFSPPSISRRTACSTASSDCLPA